jgi:hypothetical protein
MQRRVSVVIGTYWRDTLFFSPYFVFYSCFSLLIMSSRHYFKGLPFGYVYFKPGYSIQKCQFAQVPLASRGVRGTSV